MVELNGIDECFYCGNFIKWEARFNIPSGVAIILNNVQAEIVAIGNEGSGNEKKTIFEVKVKCPKCKINNKFKRIE